MLLDMDWKQDIYNLVYTHVDDVDNLRFWVRHPPKYADGSPYQRACVEVKEASKPSKFYVANLNTYGFHEISDCDNSYLINTKSQTKSNIEVFTDKKWSGRSDISVHLNGKVEENDSRDINALSDGISIYLIFSDLFPVNQSNITDNGKVSLLSIISELTSSAVSEMTIYGIADSSGDYKTNKKLANDRANVVRQFLSDGGLNSMPILVRGSVENSESTAFKRIQQRRFMIEVKLAR
ncbi:TPA: OmpA family protein [Yersinia enterocolitica]